MVSRENFEISTYALSTHCSSSELPGQYQYHGSPLLPLPLPLFFALCVGVCEWQFGHSSRKLLGLLSPALPSMWSNSSGIGVPCHSVLLQHIHFQPCMSTIWRFIHPRLTILPSKKFCLRSFCWPSLAQFKQQYLPVLLPSLNLNSLLHVWQIAFGMGRAPFILFMLVPINTVWWPLMKPLNTCAKLQRVLT